MNAPDSAPRGPSPLPTTATRRRRAPRRRRRQPARRRQRRRPPRRRRRSLIHVDPGTRDLTVTVQRALPASSSRVPEAQRAQAAMVTRTRRLSERRLAWPVRRTRFQHTKLSSTLVVHHGLNAEHRTSRHAFAGMEARDLMEASARFVLLARTRGSWDLARAGNVILANIRRRWAQALWTYAWTVPLVKPHMRVVHTVGVRKAQRLRPPTPQRQARQLPRRRAHQSWKQHLRGRRARRRRWRGGREP